MSSFFALLVIDSIELENARKCNDVFCIENQFFRARFNLRDRKKGEEGKKSSNQSRFSDLMTQNVDLKTAEL